MQDPKTEQYLKAGGYRFRFTKDLPINTIDLIEARENPARMHRRLDEDRVQTYGIAMLDGADFPAIVVFEDQPKHHLVTGLHRIMAAAEAKKVALDAYLVAEADDYRRQLLIRSINVIEGVAPSQREKLNHALEVMRLFPAITVKDVAAAFNLNVDLLKTYQFQVATEERAVRLGIGDVLCALVPTTRIALGRIQSDVSFVRTVEAVAITKSRGNAVDQLTKEVKATRSEESAAQAIEAFLAGYRAEQERMRARFGRTPSAASTRFLGKVKSLIRVDEVNKLALSGIPPEKLKEALVTVEQAIELLIKVEKALEARKKMLESHGWNNGTPGNRLSSRAS